MTVILKVIIFSPVVVSCWLPIWNVELNLELNLEVQSGIELLGANLDCLLVSGEGVG